MINIITATHRYYLQGQDKFSVFDFLLDKLLELTGSEYGFIGEILYKDEIPYLRTYAITNIAWTEEMRKNHEKYIGIGWDFMSLNNLFGLVITENTVIISNDENENYAYENEYYNNRNAMWDGGFVKVLGVGKRKVRYYKNGNPYVIVNGKKKKIS